LLPAGAVAGWDLHPLESAVFARRTPTAEMRCYAWPAADAQIDEYELAGSSHKAIGQSA
jgi:hypothetical protein